MFPLADYTIIADASAALLRLLRENLCPDPVLSNESIILIAPSDKNADYQLGLYLYDIKELSEYRNTTPQQDINNQRTRPAMPLTLSFMLYMNGKAQLSAGAELEQRILGRAVQTLWDTGRLELTGTNPYLNGEEGDCTVSILNYSFEEKVKIWSALQCPYQVGIYFSISPIMLSSRVRESFTRVTDTNIRIKELPWKRPQGQ